MKTTTTYLQGCTWCNATGIKYPMQNIGTGFSSICPICNGNKTVLVTEVSEPITTELIVPNEIIEFATWYSGMEKHKVVNAYNRYLIEIKKLNK
jgi:hypothetical protein